MKTNYYILFILLLSFSFANAQSTETVVKEESTTSVSVSVDNNEVIVLDTLSTKVIENNDLILDADKVKESIAKSSSDIRIYLNRLRNVDNIKLVFPKMNNNKRA